MWNAIVADKAMLLAGALIVLKWIYNAWTPNTTFPEFVRTFIGEIIQEAPNKLPSLTTEQIKLMAKAPESKSTPTA